jgi:Metal binding domain of Ada
MRRPARTHILIDADGKAYPSPTKGTIGDHKGSKIFGRLDCPSALRAIKQGGYVRHRVFFADRATATKAGYGPCAICLPDAYREWKDLLPADEPASQPPDVGSGI